MMDSGNHPLFDPAVTAAAERWVDFNKKPLERAGHNYLRYMVGDAPPGEQRYSHPELDDARNGLGAYGGLGFIIESGVKRSATDPNADLPARVDAYLILLKNFMKEKKHRREELRLVDAARAAKPPAFLPTNYFWANEGLQIRTFPVLDAKTGQRIDVPTANFLEDLIVKSTVPTPKGWLIDRNAAEAFEPLLQRHGLQYEKLPAPRPLNVQIGKLLRVEKEDDPVYGRYGGRTVVELQPAVQADIQAGFLYVPADQAGWRKAAVLLEPAMLYGLYQYPRFEKLVGPDGVVPVARVLE